MRTPLKTMLAGTLTLRLIRHCWGQDTSADFYTFNDASATSTYGTGFEPSRALQPGTGYWSSAGNHASDEQVAWSGTLETPGKLKGVRIRWEYAPQELQVSTSADGQNFFIAVPWRPTGGTGPSFDEVVLFPSPQECKVIVITMRKATSDFFGINQITPLGAGQPLIMIVGGVTSPSGDLCLQVEGGKKAKEGSRAILASCQDAVAAGDGRELWNTNPQTQIVSALSHPSLCLVLQGGDEADGGVLILSNCARALEEGDGRSAWTFQANAQLRLAKAGSWCMTQKNVNGSTAGLVDLIASSGTTAESSSNADEAHGPQKAIDRNSNTSWASESFDDMEEHPVFLDLNLGKITRMTSAKIEWEQPALAYTLQTSAEGTTFVDVADNPANPSMSTRDPLDGVAAQYLRINMRRPHPRLGKHEDMYRYAIKEISVFASKLEPGIGDCREAANSDDARDKYFIVYVSSFDTEFAQKIANLGTDLIAKRKSVEDASGKLEELLPDMNTCLEEKIQHHQRVSALSTAAGRLLSKFQQTTEFTKIGTSDQAFIGDTAELPADDCYSVKLKAADAVSGFYWLRPRCASKPLRAYCDMDSRTMIYVQQTNQLPQSTGRPVGLLASAREVRHACATLGLEPFIPRGISHIHSAVHAAKQMGLRLDGERGIPIAYDYGCSYGSCSSSFHDLFDGATDLTGLVLALASSDASAAASTDTAGLGGEAYGRFSYFDLATTPLEAVLCSTNVTSERSQAPALSLKCEDTLAEHEAFKATLNTNFLVECPAGCGDIESLQVFGSEGIYAERSSICKAAVHAGLIHFGGTFTVATESPSLSFEGSVQNGVKSKSLHLSAGEVVRSVRLFRIREECPGDALGHSVAPSQSPLASFLAIESRLLASPNHAHQAYDPALAEACEALKERIMATHGIDPVAVKDAKMDAGKTVGEARKRIKPAEQLSESGIAKAFELLRDTELLTNRLLATSAGVTTRLEYLQEELKQLEETHVTQQGYKSYQLNPQETTFKREFVVEDSAYTRAGPSHWGFASLVSGHKNVVGQSTAIRGLAELHGTYALLSRLNVYDFTLHVEFLPLGSGSVGVAFRMQDTNNGYLLLMHQKVGKKSLIRIEKGISKTLAQKEDGGFIQGVWHKVRIQALRGHVKVCIGEENEQDAEIFSVLDERFVAGTVGLFSSGMEDGVYFDKLKIEAHPCAIAKRELAPLPPHCSVFADTYFSSVGALYMIIDGDDKGGEAGHWEYRDRLGGRNKVLAQLNAVRGAGEVGTMAILKGQRTCTSRSGIFSFDFYPQCTSGAIGAVFRYTSDEDYMMVEAAASELRLRSTVTKKSSILGRTDMQRSLSGWHTLQVAFDGSRVAIRLQHPHSTAPTQLVVNFQPQQKTPSDGSVGLAAFNCGGVAFDTIQLSPFHAEAATEPRFAGMNVSPKIWDRCLLNVHFLSRRDHCSEMLHNKTAARQLACGREYCTECCAYHTSLLSTQQKMRCEKGCLRNTDAARKIEADFTNKVQQCAGGHDKRAALCSAGQAKCLSQACELCCADDPAADGPWSSMEADDCARHCAPRERPSGNQRTSEL